MSRRLSSLHLPAPPSFDGVSLLKLSHDAHAVYGESVYARDSFHWAALRSLRMGGWKYIQAPRAELFDLEKDPREQSNIVGANAAEAAALRSELARLMARHARAQPAAAPDSSSQTRTALEALGYLSDDTRRIPPDQGPDPKDRLTEYQIFDDALDAMYSLRLDAAIRGFQRVLKLDRDNLSARGTLGEAYLRAGKADEAVREWTAALAADRKYAPAAQALGELYIGGKTGPKRGYIFSRRSRLFQAMQR